MAVIKANPKFLYYQALYEINQGFEAITHHIETLRQSKTVAPDFLNLQQLRAEELRAGLNHIIVDKLNLREVEEWGIYSKQRIEQEKKLAEQT